MPQQRSGDHPQANEQDQNQQREVMAGPSSKRRKDEDTGERKDENRTGREGRHGRGRQ
jgi:hypothetical protein